MTGKLEGKRIAITGASKGFGRSVALTFARAGAELALLSRNAEALLEVQAEIRKIGGPSCFTVPTDVSDYASVRSAFSTIYAHWKRVDGLFNNAAVVQPLGLLPLLDPVAWRKTIDTDLNGAFYCAREALKSMMDGEGGRIVNVTSGLARFVMPRFSAYSTAKAGLNAMTLYMAEELAPYKIAVFGLDPGVMDTDMHGLIRQTDEQVLTRENLEIFQGYKERGELNPPDKSASLALYLMAEASDELSGQIGGASHFSQFGYTP